MTAPERTADFKKYMRLITLVNISESYQLEIFTQKTEKLLTIEMMQRIPSILHMVKPV